VVVMMFSAAE